MTATRRYERVSGTGMARELIMAVPAPCRSASGDHARRVIIAFILRVTSTGTGVVFAPESLLLVGLALLALHVAGVGGCRITRRR